MITMWDVYWITRLDAIHALCVALPIICGILAFCCLPAGDIIHDSILYYKKTMIGLCCALFFFVFLLVFIPSTKEAVAIYMIPKIANNEQVQKLPDNAMKFLNEKLESWIRDIGETKKSK